MARYPSEVGSWATKSYGEDTIAWEEAKDQCRTALYQWAASGRYGTYTELTAQVIAIDWPEGAYTHHGHQMGYLLGQVSLEELDEREERPVLSSLVIGQEEGMPSRGFWTFVQDELGITVPKTDMGRMEFWVDEFQAACRYFAPKAG